MSETNENVNNDGSPRIVKPRHRRRLSITIANELGVITNTIDEKICDEAEARPKLSTPKSNRAAISQ
jgi:hypothetical protein